ncbi:glycolate oxidase iron-sulfur subunit [Deltaproteobacteria bacterium]|nr:glycolate oxidase iron-sulfur subunit [Deltaproteobacteria bacterium]
MSDNTWFGAGRGQYGLAALAAMLAELDDLLVACMRCGFCMSVCPVYGATLREADVARGKIALLENLAGLVIHDAASVNDKLNRCLLCGSCQANCPSGVKIMDIYLRARAMTAGYLGLSPLKKLLFRAVLPHPDLFNVLLAISRPFQGLFLRRCESGANDTRCAPFFAGLIGKRHFPPLAGEPFHHKRPSSDIPAGASDIRVAFFPGCVSDNIFPGICDASIKALEKHGVGIFMPDGLHCCGIPALASGDKEAYEGLVRRNLALFKQASFDYLLTPCGTCTATIKEFWPVVKDALPSPERAFLAELAGKTMDIMAFLVDVLQIDFPVSAGNGKALTYHDSCHLKKTLGVAAQPRRILQSLPGYHFTEMPEADRCCGSGGSFTLSHYDLSKDIGQRKRDNILSVKAEVVAAGCPACMMQLMDAHSRNNDFVRVKHVMELYAETL